MTDSQPSSSASPSSTSSSSSFTSVSSSLLTHPPCRAYHNLPLSPAELDSLSECQRINMIVGVGLGLFAGNTVRPILGWRISAVLGALVTIGGVASMRGSCMSGFASRPEMPTAIALRQQLRERRPNNILLQEFDKKHPGADTQPLLTRLTQHGPVPDVIVSDSLLDQLIDNLYVPTTPEADEKKQANSMPSQPQLQPLQKQQQKQYQQPQSTSMSSSSRYSAVPSIPHRISPSASTSSFTSLNGISDTQSHSTDDNVLDSFDESLQEEKDDMTRSDDLNGRLERLEISTTTKPIVKPTERNLIPLGGASSIPLSSPSIPLSTFYDTYGGFFDDLIFGDSASSSERTSATSTSSTSSSSISSRSISSKPIDTFTSSPSASSSTKVRKPRIMEIQPNVMSNEDELE